MKTSMSFEISCYTLFLQLNEKTVLKRSVGDSESFMETINNWTFRR